MVYRPQFICFETAGLFLGVARKDLKRKNDEYLENIP